MLTHGQLVTAFRDVGLQPGGTVLVHSALRTLGPVEGGADTVIDALREAVGPAGTVAVPTHTVGVVNAKQPVFHQTLTPSTVGTLSNVFRQRPSAVRGLHPTHSVAAIGSRAEEFVRIRLEDDTPCPPQSPYGRLRDWGGQVLLLGVGLDRCTFFHGCEEWAGMPWAVSENPVTLYIFDHENRVTPSQRRGHRVNTWDQYPRLEPYLLECGALRIGHIGDCPLRLLCAKAAADWLIPQLQSDPRIILPDDFKNG